MLLQNSTESNPFFDQISYDDSLGSMNNDQKCIDPNISLIQNNSNIIPNQILIQNDNDKKRKKNPFSLEEDEYLKYLVDSFGKNNWHKIVEHMKKANYVRNVRQCRDRYIHYLDPNLNNDINWSKEEDGFLIDCISQYGNKWKMLEQKFPGRTEVSLRNRYNLLMRKFSREQKESLQNKKIFPNNFSLFKKNEKKINKKAPLHQTQNTKNVQSPENNDFKELENEYTNKLDYNLFLTNDFDEICWLDYY